MEVDEEYNPSGLEGDKTARKHYIERQREREAEELRLKYLGAKAAESLKEAINKKHHESRTWHKVHTKKVDKTKVRYVFEEPKPVIEAPGDKEEGEGDSISDILIQKERIRSIITPGCDDKDKGADKAEGHKVVAQNDNGRSPFQGAKLSAISINHKNVKQDPVFPKGSVEDVSLNNKTPS